MAREASCCLQLLLLLTPAGSCLRQRRLAAADLSQLVGCLGRSAE